MSERFVHGEIVQKFEGAGEIRYLMKRTDGSEFVAVFSAEDDCGWPSGKTVDMPHMTEDGEKDGRKIYRRIPGTVTELNSDSEIKPESLVEVPTAEQVMLTAICTCISYLQGDEAKTPDQNLELMGIEASRWKAKGLFK